MKIAVAGTGYVGLSIATLLAQHHQVTAVDIIPEKVEMINRRQSPIQDEYIEKYLAEDVAGTRKLDLTATLDAEAAYTDADFVVIAAPTNYDSKKNFFDTSAVESVIKLVIQYVIQIEHAKLGEQLHYFNGDRCGKADAEHLSPAEFGENGWKQITQRNKDENVDQDAFQ